MHKRRFDEECKVFCFIQQENMYLFSFVLLQKKLQHKIFNPTNLLKTSITEISYVVIRIVVNQGLKQKVADVLFITKWFTEAIDGQIMGNHGR